VKESYLGPFDRSAKWVPTRPDYTCERCGKTLPLNVRMHRLDESGDGLCDLPTHHTHHCSDGREWANEARELPPAKEIYAHVLVWLVRWMNGGAT
jgi:hypothetical protein